MGIPLVSFLLELQLFGEIGYIEPVVVVLELGVMETREIRDRSPSPARRAQPDSQLGTDAPRLEYRPSHGFTL